MNKKLEKAATDLAAVAETIEKLKTQVECLKDDIERIKIDGAIVDVIRSASNHRDRSLPK